MPKLKTAAPTTAPTVERPVASFDDVLKQTEFNLLTGNSTEARIQAPDAGDITDAKVSAKLIRIEEDLAADGPTAYTRGELDDLEQQLIVHMQRLQAIEDVVKKDAAFVSKKPTEQQVALDAEAARLGQVQTDALRGALNATRDTREGICSIVALLDLSLCDGKANKLTWVNGDAFATAATKARGERSFRDMPDDQKVGHAWPLIESAVGPNGEPLPVTLVPMADKLVFQTAGRVVIFGGDVPGTLDLEWWADKLTKAGAVGYANVNRRDLGYGPFKLADAKAKEEGTAVLLRRRYSSSNAATKAIMVCGNHVVAHPADDVEEKPVCVDPAAIYGGKHYGNEYGRPDLSATVPLTNGPRDRLVAGNWYHSLLVPSLRDRGTALNSLPMAVLTEMSNRGLDDIDVVFSSSSTMYSGASHKAEVELGTNLVRAIVMHQVLMAKGTELTDENAQAIGRDLNSVLGGLSSRTDLSLPFLQAGCDTTQCRVQDQVQRKANGETITDANGKPVLTGKKEIVLPVSVTLREGAENFAIHFVPEGQTAAAA